VRAAAGGERVTLRDWKRHLGGDWQVEDFLTKLNQDGPTLSKAHISKWIAVTHPKRKRATVLDQRQLSIDRTRFINTPAIIKALAGSTVPTPEQIATYKASHGMKTMDEGVFVKKFAKSVSNWVNTLANVRICAQQWPDSTPTHRPGSKNSASSSPMRMYSFSFAVQGYPRRPTSSWKAVMPAD
jgi:hypothetical protein